MKIAQSVMRNINNEYGMDQFWMDGLDIEARQAHLRNECFAACAGHISRRDFYHMRAGVTLGARKNLNLIDAITA